MVWPETIIEQLKFVNETDSRDPYGPFASLLTTLFPVTSHYQVNPRLKYFGEDHYDVTFVVTKRESVVLLMVVTTTRHHPYGSVYGRAFEADRKLRTGFLDLSFGITPVVPRLYGISMMGTRFAVYELDKEHRSVHPHAGADPMEDGPPQSWLEFEVPHEWWKYDLLENRGKMKFLEIVSDARYMIDPDDETMVAPWDAILGQFSLANHFTTEDSDLYGPFTSLLTAMFPHTEHYLIATKFAHGGEYEPDTTVVFTIMKGGNPIFFMEIKTFRALDKASELSKADRRMRHHFLDRVFTPKMYGLSAMGTSFSIYESAAGSDDVVPTPDSEEFDPDFHYQMVPKEWWKYDLMDDEGRNKFIEVTSEVKKMAQSI